MSAGLPAVALKLTSCCSKYLNRISLVTRLRFNSSSGDSLKRIIIEVASGKQNTGINLARILRAPMAHHENLRAPFLKTVRHVIIRVRQKLFRNTFIV